MTHSAAVDILQFANELVQRRNKAALVLTPDLREQRGFAAQLATETGALHLDLLDYFEVHEDLSLLTFPLEELFSLIARQKPARLLVISGLEFILGAWLSQGEPGQVKKFLCRRVELWEQPAFLLVTRVNRSSLIISAGTRRLFPAENCRHQRSFLTVTAARSV